MAGAKSATVLALATLAAAALAEGAPPSGRPDASASAKPPVGEMFSPFPIENYSGDFWKRSTMTGDWDGARNTLAENGFTFEFDLMNILQGSFRGGRQARNASRGSGSIEYTMKLDTGRSGLWPGGATIEMECVNSRTGEQVFAAVDLRRPEQVSNSGIDDARKVLSNWNDLLITALGKAHGRAGRQK